MNPFSGENPPFISSSRSQSWRPVRSHEGQSFDCAFNSDRKSTRLNSSHSQISYAVFCLKKKNTPLPGQGHLPPRSHKSEPTLRPHPRTTHERRGHVTSLSTDTDRTSPPRGYALSLTCSG